jgi:hypothetical protein
MNKNISNEELLDELTKRVANNDIKVGIIYYYNEEKMVFRARTETKAIEFYQSWDIKESARYRQNYEDYCLPLVEHQERKKYHKKLELLRTKIN